LNDLAIAISSIGAAATATRAKAKTLNTGAFATLPLIAIRMAASKWKRARRRKHHILIDIHVLEPYAHFCQKIWQQQLQTLT